MVVSFAKAVCVLLLLLLAFPAHALEVVKDKIKLVLYENSGVFSIYYLEDPEKNAYIPLLPDKDPRTSFVSISIWNNIYRMGQSAEFSERIEKTAAGARFVWLSKRLEVIQDFIISGDQVKIVLVLFNISQDNQSVGVRYLFDTYLGEKSGTPFLTDNGVEINKETSFTGANSPAFWISPYKNKKGGQNIGMRVLTRGGDATPVDKLVFANWQRLDESLWNYRTEETRDFNDLPYSINDSAVCMFYNPQILARGANRKIVTVIAGSMGSDLYIPETVTPVEKTTVPQPEQETAEGASEGYPADFSDIRRNMDSLNKVIGDIDQKINTGNAITDQEIDAFRRSITEVENRINQ
jgi:hypothetical protein